VSEGGSPLTLALDELRERAASVDSLALSGQERKRIGVET
jgi:hypothetical protein